MPKALSTHLQRFRMPAKNGAFFHDTEVCFLDERDGKFTISQNYDAFLRNDEILDAKALRLLIYFKN